MPTFSERKAAAEAAVTKLHEAIAASMETDADWIEYLRFVSSFRGYSVRNTMLLWMQWEERRLARIIARVLEVGFYGAPVSPQLGPLGPCAGFKAWGERGGSVRKGEKAMAVLAPTIITDKENLDADGKPTKRCVGFHLVNRTFTLQQVDDVEIPEPVTKLIGEDADDAWGKLAGLAEHLGYRVAHASLGGPNGRCIYEARLIEIEPSNDPAQQAKTLAHEIGHALMHDPEVAPLGMPTALMEIEAESVAFSVMDALGVDSTDYSLGYVAGWARGDGALITATIERVAMTAARIVEFIETGVLPEAKGTSKFDYEAAHAAALAA